MFMKNFRRDSIFWYNLKNVFVVKSVHSVRMAFIVWLIKRAVIKIYFRTSAASTIIYWKKSSLCWAARIWDFLSQALRLCWFSLRFPLLACWCWSEKTIFLLIAYTFIVSRTHIFLSLLCDQSGEVFFSASSIFTISCQSRKIF